MLLIAGGIAGAGSASTGCGNSAPPCPDCVDPNVADYRLSLVGDFCLAAPGEEIVNFLAFNSNSLPEVDRAVVDSDNDGLSDSVEHDLGLDAATADTDTDGFSDLLEITLSDSGLDALRFDSGCEAREDVDGDQIVDCEEERLGTAPDRDDSDDDGFPDPVELRFGTRPERSDAHEDPDLDEVRNGEEIVANTSPRLHDSVRAGRDAYDYNVLINNPGASTRCLSFAVSNIELKVTEPGAAHVVHEAGWNEVLLHRRSLAREGTHVHRYACALARFPGTLAATEPRSGEIRIAEMAWQASLSSARATCVCPNGRIEDCGQAL